jgi:hypothetical protein
VQKQTDIDSSVTLVNPPAKRYSCSISPGDSPASPFQTRIGPIRLTSIASKDLKAIISLVDEQLRKNQEVTLDEVKKAIKDSSEYKSFRERIAVDNPANGGFFDYSMGSSFVELVYHELKQR